MISNSWIKSTFPALQTLSDAELLKMVSAIERESGGYILLNVPVVWLPIFLATERVAEFLRVEFFRGFGGWALIVIAFVVASITSMSTHKRLMAYFISKKLNAV
jgi:hypothetical protein